MPEVRPVDAVRAEALGRGEEVVRLREGEERDLAIVCGRLERRLTDRPSARAHVVQVVERLVGDALLVEPAGEAVAREDPRRPRARRSGRRCRRRRRRTAADAGERHPLARLAADRARLTLEERTTASPPGSASIRFATTAAATPSRASTGSISSRKPAETISGSWAATSSGEARPHATVLEQPGEHLLERRRDRSPSRSSITSFSVSSRPISRLQRAEHVEVAEALDRHVERVASR